MEIKIKIGIVRTAEGSHYVQVPDSCPGGES